MREIIIDLIKKYSEPTTGMSCVALGRSEIHECVFDNGEPLHRCDYAKSLHAQHYNQITGDCCMWQKVVIQPPSEIEQKDAKALLDYAEKELKNESK